MNKCRKNTLSIKQKYDILLQVDLGIKKKSEIASNFGIPRSTLSTVIKNRDRIEAAYATRQFEPDRKRLRTAKNEDVEMALMRWVIEAQKLNVPLSGEVLTEKARFFADALDVKDFQGSSGWLHRFKDRYKIYCKKFFEAEASVSAEAIDSFFNDKLPSILKDYDPRDIFNAQQTGLFWKAMPCLTLCLKGLKCSGGESSKVRVTVLVACNMDGSEKLPLLVIGRSEKPRCFKGIKTLPVDYTSNKKAWMTGLIFTKWLKTLDRKYLKMNRKICLIVGNCPAHPDLLGLQAIKLVFLPPNTASKLQPCDQGIIHCLKTHYRKEMIQCALDCFDRKEFFEINLLEAMTLMRTAWRDVSPDTIQSCFQQAGFVNITQDESTVYDVEQNLTVEEIITSGENQLEVLSPKTIQSCFQQAGFVSIKQDERTTVNNVKQNLIVEENIMSERNQLEVLLKEAWDKGLIPEGMTFEDYVTIDDEVSTTGGDIMDSVLNRNSAEEDTTDISESSTDEEEDQEVKVPSFSEATNAINTLRCFMLGQVNSSSVMNNLDHIEQFCQNCIKVTKKETKSDLVIFSG